MNEKIPPPEIEKSKYPIGYIPPIDNSEFALAKLRETLSDELEIVKKIVVTSLDEPDLFEKLARLVPKNATPLFFAVDNKANAGYTKHPMLIGIYYYPQHVYLSIDIPKKLNTRYMLTKDEYRFNIIELRHFLGLLSDSQFELGYYFQSAFKKWMTDNESVITTIIEYITMCNVLNPLKNYTELAKGIRSYIIYQSHKNSESLLNLLRHLLVTERILKYDLFPIPNLLTLKKEHHLEPLIDQILDIHESHNPIPLSLYTAFIRQVSESEIELKKLAQIKIERKKVVTYSDIIMKGNQLFQTIIKNMK